MPKFKDLVQAVATAKSLPAAQAAAKRLDKDRRLKVNNVVRGRICELYLSGLKVSGIREALLLKNKVSLSDPTIRKVLKQKFDPFTKKEDDSSPGRGGKRKR